MIRKCEEQELDDGILITIDTQMTLYCWLRIKFKVQLIFNRVNEESERTSVTIIVGETVYGIVKVCSRTTHTVETGRLERMGSFKYFESVVTEDARCIQIKRTGITSNTFRNMRNVLTNSQIQQE